MKGFTVRSGFILIAVSAVMAVVWAIALGSALSWIRKPFPGFLVYHPPYVGSISVSDWPGRKTGLSFLDRIVAADGKPVAVGQDVVSLARSKKPGTKIEYVVESKGEKREVSGPVAIFSIS